MRETEPNVASPQNFQFDDVVVGSSPLMLLIAHRLASGGANVALVDREEKLGGAWRSVYLPAIDDEVEIACHVIEAFPDVYEYLSDVSGMPFVDLEKQPIRIHATGVTFRYLSRLTFLLSGVRLLVGTVRSQLNWWLGRAKEKNAVLNFRSKFRSYLRYQWPVFLRLPLLQGPKAGYNAFIDALGASCEKAGVQMIPASEVNALRRQGDGSWQIETTKGAVFQSTRVHCSTAVNLSVDATGDYVATEALLANRQGLMVEIDTKDVAASQTYVAFWSDEHVPRISRVDSCKASTSTQRFLVEFREQFSEGPGETRDAVVKDRLERAGILAPGAGYRTLSEVNYPYVQSVGQLPKGEIAPGLFTYFSDGNLAAGVAEWLDQTGEKSAN